MKIKQKGITMKNDFKMKFDHRLINEINVEQINSPKGRRYSDGSFSYPSITTVLGGTSDKAPLIKWRERVGEAEAEKISRNAAARGTAMHQLCEDYLMNDEFTETGSPMGEMLFKGMKPKLDRITDVRASENILVSHKLQIAGTVDCIAMFDGVLSIIDFKTSTRPKQFGWIQDYFMQGAFYFTAFNEMTGEMPKQIVILIAVEDGTVQEFVVKGTDVIKHVELLKDRRKQYDQIKIT